ncbi:MAG: TonB-dependent receptor [Bacteroidales bacterium]|nr:TonB-dependent receptor [Bacteroidales bacterium]
MGRNIFRLFAIMLVAVSSLTAYSQDEFLTSRAFEEMRLTTLVEALEAHTAYTFYFDPRHTDSIVAGPFEKGILLDEIIQSALSETNLAYHRQGNAYFLFPGDNLITELPEFETHRAVVQVEDRDGNENGDGKYLETISISRDNVITVGEAQNGPIGGKSMVTGHIMNRSTGEAMIGATIYIKELELGTITDVNGRFSLRIFPGQYTMSVNHMAMKEIEYGLMVLSDGSLTIGLENELIELEEITVFDKRRGNVKGMLMGFDRISAAAVKEIPVVMGEKDILKVAQMLPGVQNVGEGSSGFNVRGGSADQNMFYLNNISVYNTSHLFGFFTAFSPDIISDFSLYKNNVPARYGGRIASIFEINTREGNKENFFAQGGISPITGHFSMEGPVFSEKVTFVASGRSTYSDWILNRIADQDIRNSDASFWDGTLGLNAEMNENNSLKLFYYRSADKFSLAGKNDYSYSNTGAPAVWKHRFTPHFTTDISVANSEYKFTNIDKNNITEAYTQDYAINHTEARADFVLLALDNHRVEFGLNSVLYDLNRGDIVPYGGRSRRIPIDLGSERGLETSVYASNEFSLLPRLNVLLGLRYSYYGYLGPADVISYEEGVPKNKYTVVETNSYEPWEFVKPYSGIEPRAALNYSLDANSSFKASYNRLKQYIFLLSNTIALTPTDQWKLTDFHITPPSSDQVSVGYYRDFPDAGLNISVEAYKKWIGNVVEYKDGVDFISGEPIETQILQGEQDSRGLELLVKKNTGSLTGWISYTYSRSEILVDGPFNESKINGGSPYPSNYDRPHSFSLVSNYRISRRLSFSSNMVYMSGRPVTLPIAVYYSEGQQYLYYSARNKYRIPDYFRIDLSVNLEGNLKYKKLAHSFWMLNIYNLTGRNNAYSVFYEAKNGQIEGYQLSIFAQPIVTLSWNFKFGNYNSN